MERNINVNELQSKISQVIKETEKGETFVVSRYSSPVAVVISYENFLHLRGECKKCIQDLRKLVKSPTSPK